MRIPLALHRLLFIAALGVFFWLLVIPKPLPSILDRTLLDDVKLVLAKLFHLSMFAVFAAYGTFRMTRLNWKWVWLGLVLFAMLTELGQYYGNLWYDTHRTGTVMDVLIDCIGLVLGARWRISRATTPPPSPR